MAIWAVCVGQIDSLTVCALDAINPTASSVSTGEWIFAFDGMVANTKKY